MVTVNTEELIPYLEKAIELESSLYSQKKTKEIANTELAENKPRKRIVYEPKKRTISEPVHKLTTVKDRTGSYIFAALLVPVGFFLVAHAEKMIKEWGEYGLNTNIWSLMMITGMVGIAISIYLVYNSISKTKREKEQRKIDEIAYQQAVEEYKEKLAASDTLIKADNEKYERECQLAETEYQHGLARYQQAEEAISTFDDTIKETEETLRKLYDVGWIFPKYQNMVAVCSFYEYFVTGRCSQLTGADGAYNLYESEIRLDIISNKLDTIISNLEDIRNNQYMLYTELSKANSAIDGISKDVHDILDETISISEASHITSLYAAATASNTNAIKYLALLNSAEN